MEKAQAHAHTPVMLKEILTGLKAGPGKIFLDGTVGYGGHGQALLENSEPDGRLIGLDRDPEALRWTEQKLAPFGDRVMLRQGSYQDLDQVLSDMKIEAVDGILLDLGISLPQLQVAERGFSFQQEGPLDMRMDPSSEQSAEDIVNHWPAAQLEEIFRNYGEERWARRYARAILRTRSREPIRSTLHLAQVICAATPGKWQRIHPATRVFQALRIAVNDELGALENFLAKFHTCLRANGRVAILSYHSLEDRRVKRAFRARAQDKEIEIITRRPLTPDPEEIVANPRARSAKLRIAEKRGVL